MKRILLKLSGEALAGSAGHGLDGATVAGVAEQVKAARDAGYEIGIVIGGGNFWRGDEHEAESQRSRGDQIGMLATVMNCLYVASAFREAGIPTRVFTPFVIGGMTELYTKDAVMQALSCGEVLFFAGGTGHPYFSTDTATILRALEIEADMVLMAKSVDGVYDADPGKHPEAKKYDRVTIDEVVAKSLGVIDGAAAVMAKENRMPIMVFALLSEGAIVNALEGTTNGTLIVPSDQA